jgi:hypothetical protein
LEAKSPLFSSASSADALGIHSQDLLFLAPSCLCLPSRIQPGACFTLLKTLSARMGRLLSLSFHRASSWISRGSLTLLDRRHCL